MDTLTTYIAVPLIAAGVGFALLPLLMRYAKRWGLIDAPGLRKVHAKIIPLTGGPQIFLATTAVALTAMALHHVFGPDLAWERQVLTVLAGGAVVFITGMLDDLLNIPSKYKLLILLGCGAALCGSGLTLDGIYFGGKEPIDFGLFAWPITMLWITAVAVAINFIDGLDTLAGGIALIAVAVLSAMLVLHAEPSANTIVALALTGALVSFLWFNKHPAKHFMGDSGSMYLGFMIGSGTVIAAHQIGTTRGFMVPALALSVPLMDTLITMFRRHFIQRRSIFSAEGGHIHHQLMTMGLNQKNTARVIHGVTLIAVGIGLLSLLASGWPALGVLAMCIPLLLGLFHISGSARGSTLIRAIKSKRDHDRDAQNYRAVFEETQLRFSKVHSFDDWWHATTKAAEKLDFLWLNMTLRNRDGSERILRWNRSELRFTGCETLNATVPVNQRRLGGPLRMELEVAAPTSLESAGYRIALFSRLMDEHSVATLTDRVQNNGWFDAADRHDERDPDPAPEEDQPPKRVAKPARPVDVAENTRLPAARTFGQELAVTAPVLPELRVAIVHDFLYTYAGAERVLEQIVSLFPHADLFSLFDFLPEDQRHFILNKPVTTSFLQKIPFARKAHRAMLPLMPLAIEQLDVSNYDLILSSSYMAAKGVITGPDQLHVCYCHSPVRYAWDLQHQYLDESKLGYSPKGLLARAVLHYIRNWDARSAGGVDHFISNSRFIARRIEKLYRRQADVIYPPVAVQDFQLQDDKEQFYVTASRLVPYKRMDLVVEAFNKMPDKQLIVIGGGPELERIQAMAGKNVRVLGHQPFKRMRRYFQMAKGFVFAAKEDFGIVPIEAMACGTPVIAFGEGGAVETVRDGETGILFKEQSAKAIRDAVRRFEEADLWPAERIRSHAMSFDTAHFRANLAAYVQEVWAEHKNEGTNQPTLFQGKHDPQGESAAAPGERKPAATLTSASNSS